MRVSTLAIILPYLMLDPLSVTRSLHAADPVKQPEEKKIRVELPTPRDPALKFDPRADMQEIKGIEAFLKQNRLEALVGDPGMMVLDIYIAGLNPDKTALPPFDKIRPFQFPDRTWEHGVRDIFFFAKREGRKTAPGKDGFWTITPKKLYVGGLRFALNNDLGFVTGRTTIRFGEKGHVIVPIMNPNKSGGFDYINKDIGDLPTAHFVLSEAYWVYEARQGSRTEYFAIELNNMARTNLHSPFGPDYDKRMKEIREMYPEAIIGRPMEPNNRLMIGASTALFGHPSDYMEHSAEALKQLPGMVKVGTWADVQKDYPTIGTQRFPLITKQ